MPALSHAFNVAEPGSHALSAESVMALLKLPLELTENTKDWDTEP